jgi:hypothetical protein
MYSTKIVFQGCKPVWAAGMTVFALMEDASVRQLFPRVTTIQHLKELIPGSANVSNSR